ncbi:hypothetical protein TIFTF001_037383 [Ficus carica]|uniref:Uncharacterized protein n=1 Tax=Ficus carica TaxID=3494 RepID=A0AA88E9P0_FICCA|nr:hypothetical protein TIFTF001_037383 [Ficus carica]
MGTQEIATAFEVFNIRCARSPSSPSNAEEIFLSPIHHRCRKDDDDEEWGDTDRPRLGEKNGDNRNPNFMGDITPPHRMSQ